MVTDYLGLYRVDDTKADCIVYYTIQSYPGKEGAMTLSGPYKAMNNGFWLTHIGRHVKIHTTVVLKWISVSQNAFQHV